MSIISLNTEKNNKFLVSPLNIWNLGGFYYQLHKILVSARKRSKTLQSIIRGIQLNMLKWYEIITKSNDNSAPCLTDYGGRSVLYGHKVNRGDHYLVLIAGHPSSEIHTKLAVSTDDTSRPNFIPPCCNCICEQWLYQSGGWGDCLIRKPRDSYHQSASS